MVKASMKVSRPRKLKTQYLKKHLLVVRRQEYLYSRNLCCLASVDLKTLFENSSKNK
jgi:hypothetical protein